MELNDYQDAARETAIYPEWAKLIYPILGLVGEAGEVAGKLLVALWPDGKEPSTGDGWSFYFALKEAERAGRVCECLKKVIRDEGQGRDESTDEFQSKIRLTLDNPVVVCELVKENSDVLWYLSAIVGDLGVTLEDVAHTNLDKLRSRKERGVLGGSGDNR